MRALVTGAAGFVGRVLCRRLLEDGHFVRAALHRPSQVDASESVVVGDIDGATRWELTGIDVVFHLAARVHLVGDRDATRYRTTNVDGTAALARAAARDRVGRVVFASTVKVHGDESGARDLREDDLPSLDDPYGRSKWEAEKALTGVEHAIVRPPLVYGPRVRANFLRLLQAVDRGLPLPFARVTNRRSLIYVENLADALLFCATSAPGTYFAADDEIVSTPELIRRIAAALGRPARLFPVPSVIFRLSKSPALHRLTGSLALDTSKIRGLGWRPPFTMEQGLARTATWYRAAR